MRRTRNAVYPLGNVGSNPTLSAKLLFILFTTIDKNNNETSYKIVRWKLHPNSSVKMTLLSLTYAISINLE